MSINSTGSGKTSPAKVKKRRKRQNIHRAKAPTKKDRMIAPSKARRIDPAAGTYATAVAERLSPVLQETRETIQEYAKSMFRSDHPRARRIGPSMDAKWWTVQITLALTPAVLIALYCESQQTEMETYFSQVRSEERKRIMGEFGMDKEEAALAMSEIDTEQERLIHKSFAERVTEALSSARDLLTGLIASSDDGTGRCDEAYDGSNAPLSVEGTDVAESNLRGKAINTKGSMPKTSVVATVGLRSNDATKDDTMESLKKRIEALEEIYQANLTEQERHVHQRRHQLKYQLQRLEQSGVQNRLEDKWSHAWTEEEENKRLNKLTKASHVRDGETPSSAGSALIEVMKHNAQQKVEFLVQYGRYAFDAVQSLRQGAPPTKENTAEKEDTANNADKGGIAQSEAAK